MPYDLSGRTRRFESVCLSVGLTGILLISSLCGGLATAGSREQALRLHDRIAGVPPDQATLDTMATAIASGDLQGAAALPLANPAFYDVTLRNLVSPWTNEARSPFVPLNDYSATVIGVVRDGLDFRSILYADVLYVADPALGLPGWSPTDNRMYEQLQARDASLRDTLVRVPQSLETGLPADAVAGVLTSRAAAQAFLIDGTNRAMTRFTVWNHLCRDMEQLNDPTRPTDRIRQDVSRSPGGDSRIFVNSCAGCHAGMDPLTQSFAYYDYAYDGDLDDSGQFGRLNYNREGDLDPATGTRVQGKYLINETTFQHGYVTANDRWDNYWREGPNSVLGWDESLPGSGAGAASMGKELAHSRAFAQCQVDKVFKAVCLRSPANTADRTQTAEMVNRFADSQYDLKQVFADAGLYCMGE